MFMDTIAIVLTVLVCDLGQWDYRDPDNRPKNQIGRIDHTKLQVKNHRVFYGYYREKTRKPGLYSPSAGTSHHGTSVRRTLQ